MREHDVQPEPEDEDSDDSSVDPADGTRCASCGAALQEDDLACPACDEPVDDPARGICGFCGVATSERCGGCGALLCWECSDGARTGVSEAFAGVPWCPDCRAGAMR